jgi:proteasome lid subunit RPN8/RPN11
MTALRCSRDQVNATLEHLRTAGEDGKECVVLWLTPRTSAGSHEVTEVFRPLQQARADQFRIPPEAMSALMQHLRERKLKLVAQIHSHPFEAFHSLADDHWAIVRHVGALSIVVPDFAANTAPENFTDQAKFYQLSAADRWLETEVVPSVFEILP